MYRIKILNTQTGIKFYEYGFRSYLMDRIWFLFNETDNEHFSIYEILDITKIIFTWKTFFKCLTNYSEVIK